VIGCILLVRHGETEWNLERRIQGRFDSPLTSRGEAQAQAVGRLLGKLPEAASARIVASPLRRAMRTLVIDDRLREISAGAWDGLTFRDIEQLSPGTFDGDGRYEWNFRAPGGETYDSFAARVAEWLSEAAAAPFVIAVTHGVVSRVLRGLYAGLPREAALALPVPQDKVFLLRGGLIEEIQVRALDAETP